MTRVRLLLLPILLLIVALASVACNAGETADEPTTGMEDMAMNDESEEDMAGGMAMPDVPEDLDTSTTKMTDGGLFHVSVSSELDPLALNEIHSWTVHVETPAGEAVENAVLTVDGGMPQHNHGFPTAPEITEGLGGGDYLLEGVKFSMAGWWELKLTIDDGDQADSVTFNIILE